MSKRSITFCLCEVDLVELGEVVSHGSATTALRSNSNLELFTQAKHLRVNTRDIGQVIHGVIDGIKVSSSLSLVNPVTKVNTAREEAKSLYKVLYINVTALAMVTHATADDVAKFWRYFSLFLDNTIGLIG